MTEVIEKTEYKKGYKKTKLGWIPEDWDMVKLSSVCKKIIGGGTPTTQTTSYWEGNIPWISSYDINKNGKICVRKFITNEAVIKSATNIIPKGSIIVVTRVGLGKVALSDFSLCTSQDFQSIITNKELIINKYLKYYISNQINKIIKNSQGSTIKGITKEQIYNMFLMLPALKEQEKIAEILSAWDDGIETLEKLIEQKEILKNSFAQKYFQRKNNLFQLKPYKLGELFTNRKETNCCDLELLSVCDGLGIIPRSQLNAKDNSNEDKSKYLKVCIGDLAYNTMRMWQGRCGVSSYEGIVSPAYTVCIPKDNIDVDYMYYLFKTPHMIHDFWRYSQGIVDDTLNLKFNNFEVIKVWIPDKETQTKIAKLLKSYDEEIQLLNSKLEKLKEQKNGLMQKLLTGQIRVKV